MSPAKKKNPHAVALGKRGGAGKRSAEVNRELGARGGRAWWDSLTEEEQREHVKKLNAGRRRGAAKRRKAKRRNGSEAAPSTA